MSKEKSIQKGPAKKAPAKSLKEKKALKREAKLHKKYE